MKQKSENQKAFPRFLGILVVASLIGGVLGGLSGVAGYFWEDHTAFGAAFAHLLGAASPWAMAACAAVLLGLGLYQYRKARTAFRSWDGEDEDVMQQAEERLSWTLLLDSLTVIVSFFFFNAGTAKLPQRFRWQYGPAAGGLSGGHRPGHSCSSRKRWTSPRR